MTPTLAGLPWSCAQTSEDQVSKHNVSQLSRCAEMSWVDWEMTDLDGGYMYCCELQEAASVFPEIYSLDMKASGLIQIAEQLP